jgi:hypothetical protein
MAVQVRVVKIYVTAVLALKTKEKLGETQFTTKIDGFLSPSPLPPLPLENNLLSGRFFFTSPYFLTLRITLLHS